MDGDRIGRAIARIEAAASRIEAADGVGVGGDPALEIKYQILRKEAGTALAEIDRLIEVLDQ